MGDRIYDVIKEVGQLRGKVDQMDKSISEKFCSLDKRMTDIHSSVNKIIGNHEGRLNKVEEDCATAKGKSIGISLVVSLAVSILTIISILVKFKILSF